MLSNVQLAFRAWLGNASAASSGVNRLGSTKLRRLFTTLTESGSVKIEPSKEQPTLLKVDASRISLFAGGLVAAGFGFLSQMIIQSEERSKYNLSKVEQRVDRLEQKIDQLDQKIDQKISHLEQKLDQNVEKLEKSIDKIREVLLMMALNKTPSTLPLPNNEDTDSQR